MSSSVSTSPHMRGARVLRPGQAEGWLREWRAEDMDDRVARWAGAAVRVA